VAGTIRGKNVLLGSQRLMVEHGVLLNGLDRKAADLSGQGKTSVFVAEQGKIAGLIGLSDTLRDSAREAVAGLKNMGLHVAMITGDNRRTAEAVAMELGIERTLAEVLPGDKADEIRRLQEKGKSSHGGDGINDAPGARVGHRNFRGPA
jgi:Cu+-exporting ATPase